MRHASIHAGWLLVLACALACSGTEQTGEDPGGLKPILLPDESQTQVIVDGAMEVEVEDDPFINL